ncbi:MAG: hypothetical protein NTX53_21605 [candidate division WOR-3 bacterium]|nr:hypothetical protein [candidate division WOR-3 bacterium]
MLALPLLLLPSIAHAYLDPGTDSYVVQILIGTVLGGLFALGVLWRRVVASVRGLFRRKGDDDASGH